ncbi:MAG: NAD(P) transhydrogenase subunit alpha [Chthonomonadaceae bacterium]|uniref:proton-translocating NAD(P)(+) transhydrogenase n=1 Tax=Candidatus Nitrosymbiomonas proteolyticus TaxID=2608984 RepID=A0A809R990_9BACT|nr:Re/Si-specific NAD(P)(+) transhydrogenase subunit alpha [Candidatus Nitrosymbiomonas proteolyticus]
MNIGVPRETAPFEGRVALVPDGVKSLTAQGLTVFVEKGAGLASLVSDPEYEAAGAKVVSAQEVYSQSEMLLKVLGPTDGRAGSEIDQIREGAAVIASLSPLSNPETVQRFVGKKVVSFAMELIPRISRAQSMDALSSMSTIAGYRAALLTATNLPRFFPMLMTAFGTLPAARVLVIGAGVAGLQAIATCRRLGAIVEAFDVRPAVKEQIESLGAKFIGLSLLTEEAEDQGGYAKEVSVDTHVRELELIGSRLSKVDAVITTALIPGKPAPVLITRDMLKLMRPGSVIVDLAAINGGNCEATVPGDTVDLDGIRIIGRTDLLSTMAADASKMYSKNITSFLALLIREGNLNIDLEDEIVRSTLVTLEGKVMHEPTRLMLERGGNP